MIHSGNPTLRDEVFKTARSVDVSSMMTVQGTVNKTFILLVLAVLSAAWIWQDPDKLAGLIIPALIIGFIIAIVTVFKMQWAPITAPIYALVQGVVLGTISALMERTYPGIAQQAVLLTFGVFLCMLIAYKSRIIKATEKFKLGVFMATGGIAVIYFVSIIMNLFGARMPLIHNAGPLGIGFSLFVIVIASLNLIMDFDFIERGSEAGAAKYMEWYGAFALVVTLVWLYIEILRLLAKLNSRR